MKRMFPKFILTCLILLLLAGCTKTPSPVDAFDPVSASPVPSEETVAEEEVGIVSTPSFDALPTLPPTPVPPPTPEPMPDRRFSIVWASDTQTMIVYESMREGYQAICDWIVENADEMRIAAFIHTGDMVDNGDKQKQWDIFNKGVAEVTEKVPFFCAPGNHDEGSSGKHPWKNQPFFQSIPDAQKYNGGEAYYEILSVGETKLLLLSVCWSKKGNDSTLKWLRSVCETHSDLPAVLISHGYLSAKNKRINAAEQLEKDLVARCANIKLVLSGHARGIAHTAFYYDDDGDGFTERKVNALMYDIQTDRTNYCYVCILTYDPNTNTLSVDSFSPLTDDHVYDDEKEDLERFVLYDVF